MRVFKLEEYLTEHEFSAPYLLCCSDAEGYSMQEVLGWADPETGKLWQDLRLGYTETYGHPALRAQVAESLYPELTSEHILCFSGAEEGIFAALQVLCTPEDHVVVLTPCYQSLVEVPRSRGAQVTELPLREERAWRIDLGELERVLRPNTKCVVINFPHNPTGQVIREEELCDLIRLCDRRGIWLFSDEVYRLLGDPQGGWASPASCLYPRALSLGVMSKAFGMAGLRVGWIACQDKTLLQRIKQYKDYLSICNSAPAEILALIALQNRDRILARNNETVASNLSLLDTFLDKHANRFSWVRPEGGCVRRVVSGLPQMS